ncbi:ABC transporter permease [Alteromonas gilva]|uniref:ABC3 transporter permease C-terminal domain-containing protein n=1 Tax=Alteromonas gilva TaxID=2987522 RepID=A0ABT5L3N2_9ALTE|nr:FtsX-like permease family protein [Alteromonas gilva]MDC8831482.1 hypothetical protein [Alteromonas gilva]
MQRRHSSAFWRAIKLALAVQFATYRQRLWEPLLIIVAIFIACAGLTAVTLINHGAGEQLNTLSVGPVTVHEQVSAIDSDTPLTQADYARLRQLGMDYLVAYVQSSSGDVALDTLALMSHLPDDNAAQRPSAQQDDAVGFSGAPDLQDINEYYQGEVTPVSHPLSGLAVVRKLTPGTRQQLINALPAHLQIAPVDQRSNGSNLSDSFRLNLWAMGTLMLLVSVFIIFNALNLLLAARIPTLVKLRQLGIHQSTLLMVLVFEMLLLALLGAASGAVTGAALTTRLTPALSAMYQLLFDSAFNDPQLSLATLLLHSSMLSLAAVGAIAVVAFQRIKQRLSLRNGSVATQRGYNRPARWLLLLGAVVAMVVGIRWLDSQLAALLYIGLVLVIGCISVIMLMPVMLRWLASIVPGKRAVLHWSAHNAIALSRRTKLAACAFFIALAANIGMNVMVDSFRTATQSWLEQRLFAPFYVNTNEAGDLSGRDDAPVVLLARYAKDVRFANQTVELRSFPKASRFQRHLMSDKHSPDAWSLFYAGDGVFINQQLAYRQAIGLGDRLELPLNDTLTSATVVGIYPDYGNPYAQILVPDITLKQNYDGVGAYAVMAASAELDSLKQWLEEVAPDARVVARERLIEQSMVVFSRTFATTDTLNIVTMLVAALSFFVSISLLMLDITPQLLLLRTAGVGQLSIKLSLFAQYCFIALSCALIAIPFALLLAWLLVAKVNRFAFHWTYPLMLEPVVIAQTLLVGMGILLVLLLLPLGRLKAKFSSQQWGF